MTYSIIIPENEYLNIGGSPIILTLCESEEGFYWPGVGAQFPASEQLLDAAKKIKPQLKPNQATFSGC